MDDRDQVIVEESDRTVVEIQEDDATRSVVVDSETITVVTATEQGPAGTGDKHFSQSFDPTAELLVTHNLGKHPSVTVIDTAGDEVVVLPHYISNNQLKVYFTAQFGGVIYLN